MQLKVILNSIERHKGFVYQDAYWDPDIKKKQILIDIKPRRRSKGICSGCGVKGSTYDTLAARLFQFVPLWGIVVFFVYAMRRIDCKACGPTVEMVPWAEGKSPTTRSFAWFLAGWAKRMNLTDVAGAFSVGWHTVYESVKMAVDWGLKNRLLKRICGRGPASAVRQLYEKA
jgi:transposase